MFLLVALLSCSLLTLRPKLEQIKLARFAIHIRKAQSKSATPPRGRHLSTICSSHSPAHHPKCNSCASDTLSPLHLINTTSCSIKHTNASPPSSSFQKKISTTNCFGNGWAPRSCPNCSLFTSASSTHRPLFLALTDSACVFKLRLAGCKTNLRFCQHSNKNPASQCARTWRRRAAHRGRARRGGGRSGGGGGR